MATLKANNYLVPATGNPQMVPVSGPFPATGFTVDFRNEGISGAPFIPSGVFIDNTTGTATLTVQIIGVPYTITCPAGAWMQSQYPAPLDQQAVIYSNGAGTPSVVFVDFPVIPFSLAQAGGSSSNVTVSNLPTLGQKTMAGSLPVALASDQSPVPTDFSAAANGVQTSVAGSAASVTLLAANAARKGAFIVNDSTVNLYVRLQAAAASTANYSVKLGPGDTLTLSRGDYAGEIRGIWDSATGNARVTEIS